MIRRLGINPASNGAVGARRRSSGDAVGTPRGGGRADQDWRAFGAHGTARLCGSAAERGWELWIKWQDQNDGLLGREIKLLLEDTGGNPADAVRKAQEMVEGDGCNIFTGITLYSEALAVVPKLDEWNAIFHLVR